jgi:hypothetical protein
LGGGQVDIQVGALGWLQVAASATLFDTAPG